MFVEIFLRIHVIKVLGNDQQLTCWLSSMEEKLLGFLLCLFLINRFCFFHS